jgi:hypothetical protein
MISTVFFTTNVKEFQDHLTGAISACPMKSLLHLFYRGGERLPTNFIGIIDDLYKNHSIEFFDDDRPYFNIEKPDYR